MLLVSFLIMFRLSSEKESESSDFVYQNVQFVGKYKHVIFTCYVADCFFFVFLLYSLPVKNSIITVPLFLSGFDIKRTIKYK